MGIETIIIGVGVAAAIAASAYALTAAPKSNQKMKKNISELQVTRAEEGQCIPIVYGTVRVPGSIIWYGNEVFKPTPVKGAKGMGGSSESKNFKVYLDAHLVLSEGKIQYIEAYKDEEIYDIPATITFNDGTQSVFEKYATYATKLKGVASIYLKTWFLGEETYSVPSLSFKVKRILSTPLTTTVTTGENPACIVYDLLSKVGASIDVTSFQAAADYFNSWNFGLNFVFNEQQELSKILEIIFAHVDLVLYIDGGVYYLKPLLETDAPVVAISEDEIDGLVFSRKAYNQTFNDIAANYTDTNNTQRTLRVVNDAVQRITGSVKNQSYDLNGFSDLTAATDRLSQIVKKDSYPLSEITFKTSLKYYSLFPGDTFTLSYSNFGMVDKDYRITKIIKNPFQNEVEITAIEHLYTLGNFTIGDAGIPRWVDSDYTPADLTNVGIIQPTWGKYREWNGKIPILILPVRETGKEISYDVYFSADNVSYQYLGTSYSYAYLGEVAEEYPSTTYCIDDDNGLLIDYDEAATTYSLDNLTRTELFTTTRLAVINGEVIKFQTATDEGANIRLSGILRDEENRQTHSVGDKVYIVEIKNNIFEIPNVSDAYIKVCPRTFRGVLATDDASYLQFTPDPYPKEVSRLKATRTGSSIYLEIFPHTLGGLGAGIGSPDVGSDTVPHPFDFKGTFILSIDGGQEITIDTTEYSYTEASVSVVDVYQQHHGLRSLVKSITIGVDDGEYVA